MHITSQNFLKIFQENGCGSITSSLIGNGILMDSYDAFIYSYITEARYLNNPLYGYTPKNNLLLFREALSFNTVSGIFINGILKTSPKILAECEDFSYLFSSEKKIIIPIEYAKEIEFNKQKKEFYNRLISNNLDPCNYIIQPINLSKKGFGLEPLMEFLSCYFFKEKGFLVESQIQLFPNIGSPDIGIYKPNPWGGKGLILIEFAMLFLKKNYNFLDFNIIDQSVGEVKTSTTIMKKQIEKYLTTKIFHKAVEIHPTKNNPSLPEFSLLNIDSNFKLNYIESEHLFPTNLITKNEYSSWIEKNIKIYLILNLKLEDIVSLQNKFHIYSEVIDIKNILTIVNNLSIKQIFDIVFPYIKIKE